MYVILYPAGKWDKNVTALGRKQYIADIMHCVSAQCLCCFVADYAGSSPQMAYFGDFIATKREVVAIEQKEQLHKC